MAAVLTEEERLSCLSEAATAIDRNRKELSRVSLAWRDGQMETSEAQTQLATIGHEYIALGQRLVDIDPSTTIT